jgi:hypothetical protein
MVNLSVCCDWKDGSVGFHICMQIYSLPTLALLTYVFWLNLFSFSVIEDSDTEDGLVKPKSVCLVCACVHAHVLCE